MVDSRARHNGTPPRVAIIILNWNGLRDTTECLESLRKVTYPSCRVVVVDNGSSGNDVEALRSAYGNSIDLVANDRNYGFSEGCNMGIRHALANLAPDHLLLLNNDTTVAPGFLDELVNTALSDPRIGIVGPKIYFYDEPARIWYAGGKINYWLGRMYHRGIGKQDSAAYDKSIDIDFASGCCMLISKRVVTDVGLLDPGFFFGNEDYDICIRAARQGFRLVYAPRAKVWHKVGSSMGNVRYRRSSFNTYQYGKTYFALRRKHLTTPQFCTSVLWYLIAYVPRLTWLYLRYDRRWSTLKSYFTGLLDYLRKKP